MNDEFQITEVTITGSQNSREHHYNLHLERHRIELENMNLDELKRLNAFLVSFISTANPDQPQTINE